MDFNFLKRGIEKRIKYSLEKRNISKFIHSYFGGEVPNHTIDYFLELYIDTRNILSYEFKKRTAPFRRTIDSVFRMSDNDKKYFFSL